MRVAVVGAGISGLGAAYVLTRAHEVRVFEAAGRAGGHTNTIEHRVDGRTLPLDTGFLVHNERNYPLLGRLFHELGVATQAAEMSFSVSCPACGLEWAGKRPFAQPVNAIRPRFLGLLREVGRWLRSAEKSLDGGRYEELTLGEYVEAEGYSPRFRNHFLVPLTSALWSTSPGRALDFPVAYAVRFFANHGMLGFGRFPWKSVSGGSQTYVRALRERLGERLHVGLPVTTIRRDLGGVELTTADGGSHRFDKAVLATHADQALALLSDPGADERRVLGAFRYTTNDTVLHTDDSLLPATRAARAAWNFHAAPAADGSGKPTITYSLNRLQQLEEEREYCVTLNRTAEIDPAAVIARTSYEHPLFTLASLRAQRELPSLAGQRHTFYAGAYHGNGFHEDGLASGIGAAAALGVAW